MDNIFIGWSGNKGIADELARIINTHPGCSAIVGGGAPKDMFVGAQVLSQIKQCNIAILLVANKYENHISSNLMFEWGYIMASFRVNNIHTFLLNKSVKELPSDLMGIWASEISYNDSESDEEIAKQIYTIFAKELEEDIETNYFDLINNWRHVYAYLTDDCPKSDREICEYILSGCLAAYYIYGQQCIKNGIRFHFWFGACEHCCLFC